MAIGNINSLLQSTDLIQTQTQAEAAQGFQNVLEQAMENAEDDELREATEQMESYLLSMVYKQLKNSMVNSDNSLIPKGDYEVMFEDYLIDVQVDEMVKAGGIGIASMMYQQMSQQMTPEQTTQIFESEV
ncbi:MAG: hypothetical protein ATN35_00180 [Epulopiscium sp. Nele67-Bin004]|nr:MAG: hypothetical protein ATN35_00180 [Epulopiscium sp. Nele67-Bin004]